MKFSLPRFGVTRPVPVRLLSFAVLIAGLYCGLTMRREFFPETQPDGARIVLPYPGATPQEVEESMARKVEDAIADVDDVDEINTIIAENVGTIMVEFRDGADVNEGVDDLKDAIDLLQDLPDEAEEIRVAEFEPQIPVIMVTLFGDADEERLKQGIRAIRDDLRKLPGMGDIVLSGVREYEIRVDVNSEALLEHGISLPRVSDVISAWMNETPGGSMRSDVGNVNVRTMGVPERAEAIRQIIVKATSDGQSLRVGDIAEVREDYVDDQVARRFNGRPAVSLTVFKTGDQDAIDIAEMVRAYTAARRGEPFEPRFADRLYAGLNASSGGGAAMPGQQFRTIRKQAYDLGAAQSDPLPGEIATHSDLARFIEGRLALLTNNAIQGAVLIFLTILLAMNVRMSWWVVMGLVTALCGTLLLMTAINITLNLLTMFGVIVVMGMLEDDAIVVSENIVTRHQRGEAPEIAAINGAEQVFWPVLGTVLTTAVAFLPLMFVKGTMGDLLGALPLVVMCALLVSVIETMTVLPSHMAHALTTREGAKPRLIARLFRRYETWRDQVAFRKFQDLYGRVVALTLEYRYITTSIAVGILIISFGMVAGKRVPFTFLNESDAETIIVELQLPVGSAAAQTESVLRRIEAAAAAQPEVVTIGTIAGERANLDFGLADAPAGHVGQMFIELVPVEQRVVSGQRESSRVIDAIRAAVGPVDGVEQLSYGEMSGGPAGPDISVRLTGDDLEELDTIAAQIKKLLADFDGVTSITDDNYDSQREMRIEALPSAAALGLTPADIARQVRAALYGLDAHVFSEKREEIDVRVRLDEPSRRTLGTIDNLWVITPTGTATPLAEVARLTDGRGYAAIKRVNRERAVTVTADAEHGTNPEEIVAVINPVLASLQAKHPEVGITFTGRQEDFADAFSSLPLAFMAALLMIYLILACLFSSYTQPLAVMLAIPFATIGVIWGHWLLGFEMTFLSLIGFVALAGVVVNNSLILLEFFNEKRQAGMGFSEAFLQAGRERLRPILLTTITTCFGLMPLILETSFQAKFLIPMAISICFGLVSSTAMTLLVLPCILRIVEDVKSLGYYLWHGLPRPREQALHAAAVVDQTG